MAAAITVGSIINLENGAPDGGYLDTRGWITDKPVITTFQDPHIIAFVSTNGRANRSAGSGSWQIRSAQGAADGTPLKVGDAIYLLNKQVGTGYLDSFEWVSNLAPFATYPMTIGVFTSSVPDRDGGVSGTWTIESATDKPLGGPVVEGDAIYLRNAYPDAGVLQTYGHVTTHPMFADYDGQRFFVFTGPLVDAASSGSEPERGSAQWTVTLSIDAASYRVQVQRGDASSPWHSGGVFKIGDPRGPMIATLDLASADQGVTLAGKLMYRDDGAPIKIATTREQTNVYAVTLAKDGDIAGVSSEQEWVLGSADLQNLTSLNITWDKGGQNNHGGTFTGTLTYDGGVQMRIAGQRAEVVADDLTALLRGRTRRLEGVIDTTYTLLCNAFRSISGSSSLNDVLADEKLLSINKAAPDAEQIRGVLEEKVGQDSMSSRAIDRAFQVGQILSLHAVSEKLNAFLENNLRELIERSLYQHRQDKTPAPIYLYRECFERVAADHEIIQHAAIQRQWNQYMNGNSYMSDQALELLVMDKLVFKAIEPYIHLLPGVTNRISVISYLSAATHIHRLPYTDQIVLVGISYDRVPLAVNASGSVALPGSNYSSAFELMAIPHEVGHYMYHYGRLSDGSTCADVSKRFADNPYYPWCEEIFADVYGCLVAGPLSALGMHALLASINKERAWKDDEDHPTPVLRVFMLAEILRVVDRLQNPNGPNQDSQKSERIRQMTDKLDQDWLAIVESWGYQRIPQYTGNAAQDNGLASRPNRIYAHDVSDPQHDTIVNIDRVIMAIQPMIIAFAKRLIENKANTPTASQPGAGPIANNAMLDLTIPWSARYDTNLETYNKDIEQLTSRDFAGKLAPTRIFCDDAPIQVDGDSEKGEPSNPDDLLQGYLSDWGDRGPLGTGGGTYLG